MKKRLTILFIFSTMVIVSMVFALPLSNNGRLTFSASQTNTKSQVLPIYSDASYVYTINESGYDDIWKAKSHAGKNDSRIVSSQIAKEARPNMNNESVTATMLLLGTGLVGLIGIGRKKG